MIQPLVVVVDLSSSMLSDDGTGTVKLDGAKAALSSLMRRQPVGAEIGLWTYPDTADPCGSGGYVSGAEVGPVDDPSVLSATIHSLESSGETPTGAALHAVADSLQKRGFTAATVLLVSDGESNCTQPPCEVAEELVADGFDVTVEAMGFRISDEGRQELECIASATDGRYYDVEDSDALADRLDRIAVPRVEMHVTSSAKPLTAGMATTITATIENPSAQTTPNLSVSLVFTDTGPDTVMPAVVPPKYQIGNLPGGSAITREWRLSTPPNITGDASWRVTAWAPNVGAVTESGTIRLTSQSATMDDVGPMLRDLADGPVVILGDSYSSGEGAGGYHPGRDDYSAECHRSHATYAVSLFGADRTEIIACSGAVTGDITGKQAGRRVHPQSVQVRRLDPPSLVLLTLGGNDIGFGNIIKRCIFSEYGFGPVPIVHVDDCTDDYQFVSSTFGSISRVSTSLVRSYRTIWNVVNSPENVEHRGGFAPVVVLAYPQVLPEWQRGACDGFATEEIHFGNDVVAALNAAISASVERVRRDGLGVYFADATHGAMLPGHTACGNPPYVNDADWWTGYGRGIEDVLSSSASAQELMHPNADGYTAMTNALVAWSQTADVFDDPVVGSGTVVPTTSSRAVVSTVEIGGQSQRTTMRVRSGDALELRVSDLTPGSVVTITVHSAPRVLASLQAHNDGTAGGVVHLPADLPAGQHELVARGLADDFSVLENSVGLTVLPMRPPWYWAVVVASALAIFVAGVLTLRGRALLRAPSRSA